MKSRGKISIVLPDLNHGGAERVAITVSEELRLRGYSVEFVVMRHDGLFVDGVSGYSNIVNLNVRRLMHVPLAFSRYLKLASPDAVLANMWPLTSMCIIANQLSGNRTRIVVCDHCTLSNEYKECGWLHRAALRLSLKGTYPFAGARICVSSGVADDLSRLSWMRRDSMSVIHNPISVMSSSESEQIRVEKAWGGFTGKRIITVGSFKRQKNHALLIRSFAAIANTTEAKLMLIGDGALRSEYLGLVKKLQLEDKIIMPGFVSNPFAFYSSADLFVLSSDYEGFGNVIVEALASGVPVVSTNCPSGPAEILISPAYGRLTPVGDCSALASAMSECLNSEWNTDSLRQRAADFAPSKIIGKYIDTFQV